MAETTSKGTQYRGRYLCNKLNFHQNYLLITHGSYALKKCIVSLMGTSNQKRCRTTMKEKECQQKLTVTTNVDYTDIV